MTCFAQWNVGGHHYVPVLILGLKRITVSAFSLGLLPLPWKEDALDGQLHQGG